MLWMALTMPLPLLVTVVEPPLPVVWAAWFTCGALQAYMLPLQATFTLLVPARLRGRVFGLAGALSVAATGAFYLSPAGSPSTPGRRRPWECARSSASGDSCCSPRGGRRARSRRRSSGPSAHRRAPPGQPECGRVPRCDRAWRRAGSAG